MARKAVAFVAVAAGRYCSAAWACVPEVMAAADAECLAAFGTAFYPPGTVVGADPTGELGTVLGPWRAATGVMLAVDFGGEAYRCRWPDEVVRVPGALREPRRFYASGAGGYFWHAGFEYLVWRHSKGAQAWDVARKMPGGTRVDERCYVLRGVGGRPLDVWREACAVLDQARRRCPSPYAG